MTASPPMLRVLVCGNSDRGDDGAAIVAVARVLAALPEAARRRIEVRRRPMLDPVDLLELGPSAACVVVDTVVGIGPGSTVSIPLAELADGSSRVDPSSSHAIPVGDALRIAASVEGAPPRGTFVGIGGHWFGYGGRLSRSVRAGLPAFTAAITDAILALASVRD